MSEATNSEQFSAQPDSTDSTSPAWFADWADFSMPKRQAEGQGELTSAPTATTPTDATLANTTSANATTPEEWHDWQTVDFPNAISADAIDRQSLYTEPTPPAWTRQAAPTPAIALPNWGRTQPTPSPTTPSSPAVQPVAAVNPPPGPSPAQPNVAELMSLIQELNQCNSALIDRVSQLEDALDRSETALQAEIVRSQEQVMPVTIDPQELAVAHDQVNQLTNQLEFANQSQQRQQILVETLTTQLDNSQERVAQLERDCALLQQQYNEQAHALSQCENNCRDLHARLHRQQRYTLQYKAALEKCLEVPPPNYEAAIESGAAVVFQANHHLAPQSLLPKTQRIQPWSAQTQPLVGKLEALVNTPVDDLTASEQHPDESVPTASVTRAVSKPELSAGLSSLSTKPDEGMNAFSLDAAIDSSLIDSSLLDGATQPLTDLSPEAIQAGLDELKSVLDDFLSGKSEAPTDAEVALWQDLARMIEVSTDDVVKASAAQDFESFTESHPDRTQPKMDSLTDSLPSLAGAQQHTIPAVVPAPAGSTLKLPMSAIATKIMAQVNAPRVTTTATVLPTQSSAPSPLVYPLRPSKKLASLAAVDLPTFPRKSGDQS